MEFHPAANLFPLMTEAALAELAADIQEHGLHHPVTTHEGMILDGRNRYLACQKIGIEPQFEAWHGEGSPTAWVISENARRRHLTPSQLACVAADALPLFEAEALERKRLAGSEVAARRWDSAHVHQAIPEAERGRATEKVGAVVGVHARTVAEAKAVKQAAPDVFEQVKAGAVSVGAAYDDLRRQGKTRTRSPFQAPKAVHKNGTKVKNGRVIHPPKPIPELDSLPPAVAGLIREFDKGLAFELALAHPSFPLREWEDVAVYLRRRLCRLFDGKALTARRKEGSSCSHF